MGARDTQIIMELNAVVTVSKSERNAAVAAMETAGFGALRSGLGVAPGKYTFTTPNSEAIFGTKAVESAKGKFGLTLVAGTLKGAEAHNSSVNVTYGLGATDKQMVITLDQWLAIEPNQSYEITVNAQSRIGSIALVSNQVLATN